MKYSRISCPSVLLAISIALVFTACEKGPNFKEYTYPKQTATGLSPTSGYPGTYVTITGKDFGNLTGAVKVFFGGVKADSVISCTDNQIVAKVPAAAISGKVRLQVWTNTNDSIGNYTVIPAPVIKSVNLTGGAPGDTVIIKGTGFGSDISKLSVSFNGTPGTIKTVMSDTVITVIVPAAFTSGNIIVYVNGYPVTGPAFAYLVAIPAANYQLDFEGNLNDKMGGAAATYTQGAGAALSYTTGISGQAVSLAGYANAAGGTNNGIYNQILALPTNVAQYNELTVSCWVNIPALTDWTPIFDFGATRGNRICLLERATSGWNGAGNNMVGRAIFENVTGFPSYLETNGISASAIPTASWHQVAMTLSKSALSMKIYLDGALIKTQALPANYDLTVYSQTHAYVGANSYGTANEPSFTGSIDKFQVFNSTLSANQIYTIYYKK